MNRSPQRCVGAAALAGVVFLAGCSAPAVVDASPTPPVTESKSPTPTPTETSASSGDLSFDDGGGDLTVSALDWGDPFQNDPGFSVLSPDDGNGSWSYVDNETQCRLVFYQGAVTDLDFSADDRTITDQFLTIMLSARMEGVTQEDVTANAFDDSIWQPDRDSTVAVRTIWGTGADGSSWMGSARMLGTLGGGVHIDITCPAGQDMIAEHNKLFDDHLTILVS